MTEFTTRVSGLAQVELRLVELGQVTGEKIMRSSMFYATKPMRDAAAADVAAIPGGSGALHRAIKRIWERGGRAFGRGTAFVMHVGAKKKDRAAINLANLYYKRRRPIRGIYWGHFIEWGTRRIGGTTTRARRIFTRAAERTGGTTVERFRQRIGVLVDRATRGQRVSE